MSKKICFPGFVQRIEIKKIKDNDEDEHKLELVDVERWQTDKSSMRFFDVKCDANIHLQLADWP